MRSIILFTTLVFALMAISSCKKEPAKPVPQQADTPAVVEKKVEWFVVRVGSLRLRSEPNQESDVVTHADEGAILAGTGKVTAEKDTAELRGMVYTEPYYQVTTTNGTPAEGWVFGGGILRIYEGPEALHPDLDKISRLTDFLKKLKPAELSSGGKAWNFVKQEINPADPATADAVYTLLDDFFAKMEVQGEFYTLTEGIKWENSDYQKVNEGKYAMKDNPVTRSLMENGFALATAEGSIFPVPDIESSWGYFSDKVSPAMNTYLRLTLENFRNPDADDGGLVIPLADVADRAIGWERLLKENPHFFLREEAEGHKNWYAFTLLMGMNNTPATTDEAGILGTEFLQAWKAVLAKYPDSELAQRVRTMMGFTDKAKGKMTEDAREFARSLVEN